MEVRWTRILLLSLIGVTVLIIGLQARYISILQHQLEILTASGKLRAGADMKRLMVSDLNGNQTVLEFENATKPTILYVFRPACVWCERNAGALESLANAVAGSHRLIGLSLVADGTAEFVSEHRMKFPVYTGIPSAAVSSYKLGATPETILIDPHGKVVQSWKGAYVGVTRSAIEEVLSVKISGYSEE